MHYKKWKILYFHGMKGRERERALLEDARQGWQKFLGGQKSNLSIRKHHPNILEENSD